MKRSGAAAGLACLSILLAAGRPSAGATDRPNLVFILADDLGYGDLGCYGQPVTKTPRLDRMAAEGLRFTQFYAGSTVCAPSRCVLMTGRHAGHAHVRGNASGQAQSLRDEDVTVAEVLKGAGYATALVGKWGLGEPESPGHPLEQGFDCFYGYLNQTHAHNYYPEFLWRNRAKETLQNVVHASRPAGPGGFSPGWATKRIEYSHDLFAAEALRWIRERKGGPFFLYLALTVPHANNEGSGGTGNGAEVPDYGPYADTDWPDPDKGQAAMITRMDGDIGKLLDLLRELGIADRTLVMFSSDNGPHNEARHNLKRFTPAGPLRGIKRDLYEGGIRVPLLAWWPGMVKPGGVSDHLGYFGDLMATAAELAGARLPDGLDSISLVPTLRGEPEKQKAHDFLYWEFYEQGSKQAVRQGDWKAVRRPMLTGKTELYDLAKDVGEAKDVAGEHPEVVASMEALMKAAHVPHPAWQVPAPKKPATK